MSLEQSTGAINTGATAFRNLLQALCEVQFLQLGVITKLVKTDDMYPARCTVRFLTSAVDGTEYTAGNIEIMQVGSSTNALVQDVAVGDLVLIVAFAQGHPKTEKEMQSVPPTYGYAPFSGYTYKAIPLQGSGDLKDKPLLSYAEGTITAKQKDENWSVVLNDDGTATVTCKELAITCDKFSVNDTTFEVAK